MRPLERLRQEIDHQQGRLRAAVPADHSAAILALLRARDTLQSAPDGEPVPDLITGQRVSDLGGNKALQLCLEAADDTARSDRAMDDLDGWAVRFLAACGLLAESELVLAHCEGGFLQAVEGRHGAFDAWIATKRVPTSWRERADVDWWAAMLRLRHEPDLRAVESEPPPAMTDARGR